MVVPPRATSSLCHYRYVPPFLPKAQTGGDRVVGMAANLVQLPSYAVDKNEPYVHDHFLWGPYQILKDLYATRFPYRPQGETYDQHPNFQEPRGCRLQASLKTDLDDFGSRA